MKMQENIGLVVHGFHRLETSTDPRIEFQTLNFTMSTKTFNQLHNRMETGYSRVLLANKNKIQRTYITGFGTKT